MKISKLFHWLYAILMLLPFAFFVPSVLYYAFNDNATMQTVEVPKTETIAVDFNQNIRNGDFLEDTEYYTLVNLSFVESDVPTFYKSGSAFCSIRINEFANFLKADDYYLFNVDVGTSYIGNDTTAVIVGQGNGSEEALSLGIVPNSISTLSVKGQFSRSNFNTLALTLGWNRYFPSDTYFYIRKIECFNLTQMFGSGNEPTISQFNEWFTRSYYPYTESELMQITYDTGNTEQLVQNTDIVNYAWESIWNLPLFSWSKVSFVAVPFTFITGLFGLAPSNSFNYVFTYFASMSIIWLVFDVVLYVPLLVHRWLDKGIVE